MLTYMKFGRSFDGVAKAPICLFESNMVPFLSGREMQSTTFIIDG